METHCSYGGLLVIFWLKPLSMLSSEYFYNYFQLNHFDYKQEANRHLLELNEKSLEETYPGIEPHKNILIVKEVLG